MSVKNKKYGGYLLTEMIVSMSVLAILLIGLALSLDGFRRFNHYQLVRQRCIAAAEAELDSITVTGRQIPAEDFEQLWPKLSVSVEQSDGAGQWSGMKFVEVTASGNSFNKQVKVRLCRYISAETKVAKWKLNEPQNRRAARRSLTEQEQYKCARVFHY